MDRDTSEEPEDEQNEGGDTSSTISITCTTSSTATSSCERTDSNGDLNENKPIQGVRQDSGSAKLSSSTEASYDGKVLRSVTEERCDPSITVDSAIATRSGHTVSKNQQSCSKDQFNERTTNRYSSSSAGVRRDPMTQSEEEKVEKVSTGSGRTPQAYDESRIVSSYANLCPSLSSMNLEPSNTNHASTETLAATRRTVRPAPSPSPSLSVMDTNNNKNSSSTNDRLSSFRRTNFSKSATGSRLVDNKSRSNLCDCLTQDCEKEHSNRRQFIEHFYNSRTKFPSANTSTSSFNISSPLNRLSECDAITKRLLSSPIKTPNVTSGQIIHRTQLTELDKSRRASLGTNSMTDQVFLFAPNPFKSAELSSKNNQDNRDNRRELCDSNTIATESEPKDYDAKRQQGRSLSVCDEETFPRVKIASTNHSSYLSRAISLACESGPSRRSWTIIPLFGCDIKSLDQFVKFGLILPPAIDSAVDHILTCGINAIGIFRKSGVKSRILNLKQRIEANQDISIDELNRKNEFSIYDVADLVKMWYRELRPTPLMTKEMIKLVISFLDAKQSNSASKGASDDSSSNQQEGQSKFTSKRRPIDPKLKNNINSLMTPTQKALFYRTMSFFNEVSSESDVNQMTSQNLAICLTPSLCATEPDQNSILLAQKALEFCIDNHDVLFDRTLR